jgi:uncharacterized RDD family membrane protein YckC
VAELAIETPEGVVLRHELAGPGTRILAAALDGLVFGFAFLTALLVLPLLGLWFGSVLIGSGAVLLLVAYSFLFPYFLDGRTPGKLWTGIRVCDAQGFVPRPAQLFLRSLFVPLEAALLFPVPLTWILVALTPRRQRLGDLAAGTVVLRERGRRAPPEPVPRLTWSGLQRRAFALDPAAVRELSGADLGFLRELLTRTELDLRARQRLRLRAARHFAARLGLERDFTPEEALGFLRELFLLLRELRSGALRP